MGSRKVCLSGTRCKTVEMSERRKHGDGEEEYVFGKDKAGNEVQEGSGGEVKILRDAQEVVSPERTGLPLNGSPFYLVFLQSS